LNGIQEVSGSTPLSSTIKASAETPGPFPFLLPYRAGALLEGHFGWPYRAGALLEGHFGWPYRAGALLEGHFGWPYRAGALLEGAPALKQRA
jgi:hypothetical protein